MKWFRFYHDAIDDPKVQRLPGELFKFWINMLCLGSRSDDRGVIALDVEAIAFAVRVSDDDAETMLTELVKRGLLEDVDSGYQVHNWQGRQFKSDNVSERVNEHRSRRKSDDETLPETLHATPGETETPSARDRGESEIDTETETENRVGDAPTPPTRAKPSPKRGTRIPDDFAVTDELRDWARGEGATDAVIDRETAKFRDYWPTVPGQKGVKLDWDLTWKTWMRRALETSPPGSLTVHAGGRASPRTTAERNDAAFDDYIRRTYGGDPGPERAIETTGKVMP